MKIFRVHYPNSKSIVAFTIMSYMLRGIFVMSINIALVFHLFGIAAMSTAPGRKWIRTASGFAPVSGFTLKVSSRSVVDCSRVCSQLSATQSYFYYETSGECECHDSTYSVSDAGVIATPNVRYYEGEEEGGTLLCPADVTSSTNVISSGSSRFRIRAFLDTSRDFYDSETRCASVGGTLFKAVTWEKYQVVYQLITECTGTHGGEPMERVHYIFRLVFRRVLQQS